MPIYTTTFCLASLLALLTLSGCSQISSILPSSQNPLTLMGINPEQKDEATEEGSETAHAELKQSAATIAATYQALAIDFGIDPPEFLELNPQILWLPQTPAPENLWQLIPQGFALDYQLQHPKIISQRDWYAKHPSYFNRVVERARPYLSHIVGEIESSSLPMELALLPIVESAFEPFAYSHGRAAGIWQFIPSTGKIYGLRQNWWFDGRRDIVDSTDAALTYLSKLNRQFDGDWLLALAAYNSGAGTVRKAMRKNKRRGKPTDFWHLRLPRETRAYVPKLLALAQIVAQPENYNIDLAPVPNQKVFDLVDTQGQIDLAQAARMANLEVDELYRFNPGFNSWATDPEGPHFLVLPLRSIPAFNSALVDLPPQKRVKWERYTVQTGDSLIRIAKRFNSDVAHLRSVNGIKGHTIIAGKEILIPSAMASADTYALSSNARLQKSQNRQRAGKEKVTYTVRSGDSFWTISRKFKVSMRSIASTNNLATRDRLYPGQKLVIWLEDTKLASRNNKGNGIIRKVNYRVRNGDSLSLIAQKFNVSVRQIAQWNPRTSGKRYLQPGDKLTVFVDVTNL